MRRKTNRPYPSKAFFVIFLFSLFAFASPAFAVFQLTVTPDDGGYDLRFGRVSAADFKVAKQVTIRVSSDTGNAYRVFQRVLQPLATSTGLEIPEAQFRMYPRVGSNTMGTLLYIEETPLSHFDSMLYTSNSAGTGDSFQLVYTITPKPDQLAGTYFGRIALVLVPVDANESQVVVTLNVYAELAAGPAGAVEIGTETGQRRVSIRSERMGFGAEDLSRQSAKVGFKISSPFGARYRIYQRCEGNGVVSDRGEDFDLKQVAVAVDGVGQGVPAQASTLQTAFQKQLLYTSNNNGAPDQFIVSYAPEKDFRLQKPGAYKGRLSYILEIENSRGVPETRVLDTYDLAFDVAPLFDINVTTDGVEGVNLKFGEVSYKSGPKESQVEISVVSNLGQRYQVVQKVYSPMMNEFGDRVPSKDFTVKADLPGAQEMPVKEGEAVVFDSGPDGAGARVVLTYRLTMGPDSKGGRYSAQLGYSLVQL